ncbi:hypothetical protein BK772_16185 [Bacillus thuringiensis serovar finitimus]|uniref:Uncharacterized protein n=1 Tax=Bacillus thuringiensis subsp. finitimus TaxID=29337 RepID=A0A243GGZ3_BACTF|nr:hypothetical protein ATN06_11945 [Bacillus thuringiensis]OUA07022.1 hypothetical protein BK772_16185 [Bacillus thuringiensis serovar finitimus]
MLFSLFYRKYTLNVTLNEMEIWIRIICDMYSKMYMDDLVIIKRLISGMGEKNEDNRTTN